MNADRTSASKSPPAGFDAARLAAANINPVTRLATDYLNHFNEAIMLLEMLATVPDFAADVLVWRPLSYHEYFTTSHFKERELAIAAFAQADPDARKSLEELAEQMNTILVATRDALAQNLSPAKMAELGTSAAGWLKPLVARAGSAINGHHAANAVQEAPQAVVDHLFERR
jgi:hypothetical protein